MGINQTRKTRTLRWQQKWRTRWPEALYCEYKIPPT